MDNGIGCKGGLSEKGRNFPAILGQTLGAVAHDTAKINGIKILTGIGPARQTVLTMSAVSEGKYHMIPLLKLRHSLSHLLNNTASLMAQDGRERYRNHLMLCHLIRVAYTAGRYLYHHFPLTGILQVQFLKLEGLTFLSHNCCCYLHLLNLPFSDLLYHHITNRDNLEQ